MKNISIKALLVMALLTTHKPNRCLTSNVELVKLQNQLAQEDKERNQLLEELKSNIQYFQKNIDRQTLSTLSASEINRIQNELDRQNSFLENNQKKIIELFAHMQKKNQLQITAYEEILADITHKQDHKNTLHLLETEKEIFFKNSYDINAIAFHIQKNRIDIVRLTDLVEQELDKRQESTK